MFCHKKSVIQSVNTRRSTPSPQHKHASTPNNTTYLICWVDFVHIVVELFSDLITLFQSVLPDCFLEITTMRFSIQWGLILLLLPVCCDPNKQSAVPKRITRFIQKTIYWISTPLLVIINLYESTLVNQYTKLLGETDPDNTCFCFKPHKPDPILVKMALTLPTLGLCYFSDPIFVDLLGQDTMIAAYATELLTPYALLTWPLVIYDAICLYLLHTGKYKTLICFQNTKWLFCTTIAVLLHFDISASTLPINKLGNVNVALGFANETTLTVFCFLLSIVNTNTLVLFG